MAKLIRDNTKPGQRVFGPEATVLTYLSGRDVFPLGILLPKNEQRWDRKVRKMTRQVPYAVFPDAPNLRKFDKDKVYRLFDDKDRILTQQIERGALKPTRTIATNGVYKLCEYEVVPPGRRRLSTKDRTAATQPKKRKPATTQAATTGPTTRKVKKKPATTQATTKASTQPATQPRKRRKPTTATAPTTRPTTKTSSTPGQSVCRSTTVSAVPDYLAVQAGWCADESGAALGSRGSPALCRGVGWVF